MLHSLPTLYRPLHLILVGVSIVALSGCAQMRGGDGTGPSSSAGPSSSESRGGSSTASEIGFVVVGDSLTAGTEPLDGNRVLGAASWVPAADDPPLTFLGGWAVPGATTAAMLEEVVPMDGDVLVLMAGTNDLVQGHDLADTRANLVAIVDEVNAPEVLLSAVGPLDSRAAEVTDYNRQLEALAAESGWTFVDPWGDAWNDGSFVEGASADGVHPTSEYADRVGREIRAALLASSGE
jgi:lysophospholipase L1-like esterase